MSSRGAVGRQTFKVGVELYDGRIVARSLDERRTKLAQSFNRRLAIARHSVHGLFRIFDRPIYNIFQRAHKDTTRLEIIGRSGAIRFPIT